MDQDRHLGIARHLGLRTIASLEEDDAPPYEIELLAAAAGHHGRRGLECRRCGGLGTVVNLGPAVGCPDCGGRGDRPGSWTTREAAPWRRTERPGWADIIGFTGYLLGDAVEPDEQRRLDPAGVLNGRLRLEAPEASGAVRGFLAAAEALSAETCERCGGKGDPVAGADGAPAGCRCRKCRPPA